jgi:hypothetical protein
MPKFELYKHNDELFNIYYGIFYELWTFTDFDRLCKLEKKGGMKFKKNLLLWNYWANLNQTLLKWSKIEQFWPFEEISIFLYGGHFGYTTALTDTFLKGTLPGTIPARFGLIWFSGFRGEDLNVIFYQNMPNIRHILIKDHI